MTCKDCINEDYCKSMCSVYYDHLSQECEMFCRNKICEHRYDNADKNCKGFKDKSKIIELPCKVGDTVYSIHYGLIYGSGEIIVPCLVSDIEILLDNSVLVTVVPEGYERRYGIYEYSFGKNVFLTREEAEAKLKEMNGQ